MLRSKNRLGQDKRGNIIMAEVDISELLARMLGISPRRYRGYNYEVTHTVTTTIVPQEESSQQSNNLRGEGIMVTLKRFCFFAKWSWKNRNWDASRQKRKRAIEDYKRYKQGKPCKYL